MCSFYCCHFSDGMARPREKYRVRGARMETTVDMVTGPVHHSREGGGSLTFAAGSLWLGPVLSTARCLCNAPLSLWSGKCDQGGHCSLELRLRLSRGGSCVQGPGQGESREPAQDRPPRGLHADHLILLRLWRLCQGGGGWDLE